MPERESRDPHPESPISPSDSAWESAPEISTPDLDRRLMDQFMTRMTLPQIMVVLIGLIESLLVWINTASARHGWIIGWYVSLLLVSGYRFVLIRRYHHGQTAHPATYWAHRLTVALFLSGLVWALAWWLPGLYLTAPLLFINLILLIGLVAGSTVTNFWLPWGSRLFALPILATVGSYLIHLSTDFQLSGGLMIVLFWITIDRAAQGAHRSYRESVLLTLQTERFSAQLNSKNQILSLEIERRKTAEEGLQRDRGELLQVIDSIPALTGIVTADFRLRRVNRALAEVLGIDPDPEAPLDLVTLVGSELFDQFKSRLERALHGSAQTFTVELNLETGSSRRYYAAHAIPTRSLSGAGKPECILLLEDVTALKRSQLRLEQAALHDPLTGLGNRRLLERSLYDALDRVPLGEPGILMLLDLDGFKTINDHEGHPTGDRILVAVGQALIRSVRKTDTVCRLGGDEFAVILPLATREAAERIALKIQSEIHEQTAPWVEACLPPTASIGLVALEAAGLAPEACIQAADQGLYEAKRQGGHTHVWGPTPQT